MIAFLCSLATAADTKHPHAPTFLSVGAYGVVSPEGWLTQYVYVGPGVVVHVTERVAFVPNIVFEAGIGSGAWGFAASAPIEFLPNEHIGIDFVPSMIQDTIGDETTIIAAFGPGITYFTDQKVGLSLLVQAAYAPAHELWTLNPAAQVAVPFP